LVLIKVKQTYSRYFDQQSERRNTITNIGRASVARAAGWQTRLPGACELSQLQSKLQQDILVPITILDQW